MKTTRAGLTPAAFLAAILFGASVASAAPLTYQESVSGDLPMLHGGVTLGFDIGTNTVSGTSRVTSLPLPIPPPDQFFANGIDFDAFDFSIPSGAQLTSVKYAFTMTDSSATALTNGPAEADFRLDSGSEQAALIPDSTSPITFFPVELPVGSGVHALVNSHLRIVGSLAPFDFVAWQYTWTFEVAPAPVTGVPEPGTLGLLGSAFTVFMARTWRRHVRRLPLLYEPPRSAGPNTATWSA